MKDPQAYLARRVAELHADLRQQDMHGLAQKAGASVENGRFHLHIWNQPITVTPPNFMAHNAEGQELDTFTQALLAYYLHTTNGAPLAGEWIAFTELPDGQFYTAAFQGYTGNELTKTFGNEVDAFAETAVALGGRPVPFADRAFAFRILPHVAVMVAAWQGDEDFPPSYRILFDSNTAYHLPTDACAIIGSTLTHKLLRTYQQQKENP